MTLEANLWAARQETGDPVAKLALLWLSDRVDMDGWVKAELGKLAVFCEVNPIRAVDALKHLVDRGLIRSLGSEYYYIQAGVVDNSAPDPQRLRIYSRDDYACVYCGSGSRLTLDHVLPRSRGGSNEDTNLVTACQSCNSSKGARTPEEWRAARARA